MYIGEVCGVRVRINGAFLVLALGFVLAGLGSHALALLLSIAGHEMAHFLVASGFGHRPTEVDLYPFGGALRFEDDWGDTAVEAVVALAGPLHNLAVSALAWWLSGIPIWRPGSLTLFIETNLAIGLFNLFPVLPLDGGRVLRAMLTPRLGYREATKVLTGHGRWIAATLVALGAGMVWTGQMAGVNLAVAGAFLFMAAGKERRSAAFLILLDVARKKEVLLKKGQMPVRQIIAHRDALVEEVARGFSPGCYHLVVVADDDLAPLGRLSELQILDAMLNMGGGVSLGRLLGR
ncbi:MAG: M50 family metallopeptidase [Bacillota bacterium]